MRSEQLDALVGGWLSSYASPNTQAAYRGDLHAFRAWCASGGQQPLTATTADVAAYFAWCEASGSSRATMARRISALDSFYRFACDAAVARSNPVTAIERPNVAATSSTSVLDDDDAASLLTASDRLGAKAGALVRLLMLDGVKLGEALAANANDFERDTKRPALTIERGRRSDTVALHVSTARRLDAYLGRRRRGPLLCSETPGRESDRLTRFGADYVLKQVAQNANVDGRVSANTLRRRYVMASVDAGVDVEDIRDHFGHRDARTAERYLESSNDTTSERR
jgi:site-specific recombinase XerD